LGIKGISPFDFNTRCYPPKLAKRVPFQFLKYRWCTNGVKWQKVRDLTRKREVSQLLLIYEKGKYYVIDTRSSDIWLFSLCENAGRVCASVCDKITDVSSIARATGIGKGEVHNILKALSKYSIVINDGGRYYGLPCYHSKLA
jgi:hypothetical protein